MLPCWLAVARGGAREVGGFGGSDVLLCYRAIRDPPGRDLLLCCRAAEVHVRSYLEAVGVLATHRVGIMPGALGAGAREKLR